MPRPAVFLDRDGTLIREVDYLTEPEQVELLPGVGAGLRLLAGAGHALVVVTNQSAVARGMISESRLAEIHARMRDLLAAEDVRLDHIAFCPHHPKVGLPGYRVSCSCRKPAPGMLLDAAERLGLDLSRSWTIGDKERDLEAGRAAGTSAVLVRTGTGEAELRRMREEGNAPRYVAAGLEEAAGIVLG